MRVINLKRYLTLETREEDREVKLKENEDYVVPDGLVAKLEEQGYADSIFSNKEFYEILGHKIYNKEDLTNKSLLSFRNGGIGDLMFQLPAVRELKEKYPSFKFYLCCSSHYKLLFEGIPYIDGLVELPLSLDYLKQFDYFVNFENLIENNDDAEIVDAYELHARKFFIEPKNYRPELVVNKNIEKEVLKDLQPYKDKIKIIISFAASATLRSVNPLFYKKMIELLNQRNDLIFFISGSGGQSESIDKFINSLANKRICKNVAKIYGKNIQQTMALIKNSHCVVGPDSGLLHIAGGLSIPLVGIFGAFPPSLRLKYYKNGIGLKGFASVHPCHFGKGKWNCCFQHKWDSNDGGCFLAEKKREVYSPCMDLIKPEHVIEALKKLKII